MGRAFGLAGSDNAVGGGVHRVFRFFEGRGVHCSLTEGVRSGSPLADLAVDSHTNPTLIRVRIKQSKTDPFRLGADIFLGASSAPNCPVQALVNYIAVRSPSPGPLFCFESGSPLSRASMVSEVQQALTNTGLEAAGFTGHSFRIGAANTAAKRGFEDSLIQTLGRWKSSAYLEYIRIPRQDLAGVARKLMEH